MKKNQTLPEVNRTSAGQFQSGQSGNPRGRPRGIIDKRTRYRIAFEEHSEALIASVIKNALEGDTVAQKMCLDRLVPPLKSIDKPITVATSETLAGQGRNILQAITNGDLTPSEAESVFRSLSAQARITELSELEQRIEALERAAV